MISLEFPWGVINPNGVVTATFENEAEAVESAKRRLKADRAETGKYVVVTFVTALHTVCSIVQSG